MAIDVNYLEECIVKTMLVDKSFASLICDAFNPKFFQTPEIKDIFGNIKKHITEYRTIPSMDMIAHSFEKPEPLIQFFQKIGNSTFDYEQNYEWLFHTTNEYLKEQAVKYAILDSFAVLEKGEDIAVIRSLVEEALCKDIKIDLGHNYFEDVFQRLKKIAMNDNKRVPTYFPQLDEYINGGLPPQVLGVILGGTHSGKSQTCFNIAANQVLHGHNVVLFTLEMSEEMFAQRFDSSFSLMDINRMYVSRDNIKKLALTLKDVKDKNPNMGTLYIKEFPPSKATVNKFRSYIRELLMRNIQVDCILVDYINLMRAVQKVNYDNMYKAIQIIAQELRALAFEFNIPILTPSQLNRDGMTLELNDLEMYHISESKALADTADFIMCLGRNTDAMVYQNELHYKILKNRIGGRVGEISNFFIDQKTLKMYDVTQLDVWLRDAMISGDAREAAVEVEDRDERPARNNFRRGRN